MDVILPPEFEAYARAQVEAGTYASVPDVIADALLGHLARLEELRAEIDVGLAQADRGELIDGRTAMRELIADARRHHRW